MLALAAMAAVIGISLHPRNTKAAKQATPAPAKPLVTFKNQEGAPLRIVDASASDAGIFQATLQFDGSGSWNAYGLRWKADYGPGHQHTFWRLFDKTFDPETNHYIPDRTFPPNALTFTKHTFLANDKNDIPLHLQKAEVELVFLIKNDGSTWGDITADTTKQPNGEQMSPYLSIMALRKT